MSAAAPDHGDSIAPTARVRSLLDVLVAHDTTSRNSNLKLITMVEDVLDGHAIPHQRVPSPDGDKANLIARIGPDVPGGVVLCAHTDCVPVDGQDWDTDPFTVTARDGRLYGRGTSDMKGFIAVVLAALPAIVDAPLERPIFLAFTYDEEVGTVGAPAAVAALLETWARPEAVIIGEPTSMEVVTDHKGVRAFTVVVDGLDGHSSKPHRAANAIAAAARIATYIDDLAERHRDAGDQDCFDPPYTSFNLATVHGGEAINIVPGRCELRWEYRPVPGDDSPAIGADVQRYADEVVLPRLRAGADVGDIVITPRRPTPAMAREPDGVAEALVRELTGYHGPAGTVPFGTDGGHFQAAGVSTVVCGPGSIDQAHTPNEWIESDQLASCGAFLGRLVASLS